MTMQSIVTAILILIAETASRHNLVAAKLIEYNFNPCPEVPTLHCKNGSTCTPGLPGGTGTFGAQHDHLELQTHESQYHCKCKPGYIGHECQLQVDECNSGSGTPACYNGSKCKTNSNNSASCDCNSLNSNSADFESKFAGAMCQHSSTSFCAVSLVGNYAPNHQFCTNHGKCKRMVSGGELHPGCICKDGYMGDHCEIRVDPFAPAPVQGQEQGGTKSNTGAIVLISLMIVAAVLVTGSIAFAFVRSRKRKRDADNGVTTDAVFQGSANGTTRKESTVVGEGDLNPDGSATFGGTVPKENGNGVAMEIADNIENGNFSIEDEDGDDESPADDDATSDDEEPYNKEFV